MKDNSLRSAPELTHQPGEPGYTHDLYQLLKRLHLRDEHEPPIAPGVMRDWYDLKSEHIGKLPLRDRHVHQLALTPRATLGGFELSSYAAGLATTVCAGIFFGYIQDLGDTGIAGGVLLGSLVMALVNRRAYEAQQRAHAQLGLPAPTDRYTGMNF
ncbi:hypothetical protein [Deinococcus ficus]|uniref:Uncharacterized protein n=1 Tax=Deinococcus ficus TaxID=317577 RepID=A0A221T2Y3_9DEIO|nr:hypothetical protein [Deinococcus ficus]ASN83253.1 hypothetical protein DFI_18825 [Deinococcus ficus]